METSSGLNSFKSDQYSLMFGHPSEIKIELFRAGMLRFVFIPLDCNNLQLSHVVILYFSFSFTKRSHIAPYRSSPQ